MSSKIYKMLKMVAGNRMPGPLKLLGLWGMHLAGRRTIGIFIDPVLACNLRCRMCYFSDPEKRAQLKGIMSDEEIDRVDKALFHRALKLQIGCGAEPTLYNKLPQLVQRGHKAGIPYIALTTNGQLIASGRVDLNALADAGLNEITLSMHGTRKETYEYLMPGASYENLIKLIDIIDKVKALHPDFQLRVNFTVNSMNVEDLRDNLFWRLWENKNAPDIIQLRPVQNLGESAWTDFDLSKLKTDYDATIGSVANECLRRGITCIAPTLEQIDAVDDSQDSVSGIITDFTYCYVGPDSVYRPDFEPDTDTYESYHKRRHSATKLFKAAFQRKTYRKRNVSKKLNYNVK